MALREIHCGPRSSAPAFSNSLTQPRKGPGLESTNRKWPSSPTCQSDSVNTNDGNRWRGDYRPTEKDGPFTLTVDGEAFTVEVHADGRHSYDWVSGPNTGYGFSSSRHVAYPSIQDRAAAPSGFEPDTVDEHCESIRVFLGAVNPETGYIGD